MGCHVEAITANDEGCQEGENTEDGERSLDDGLDRDAVKIATAPPHQRPRRTRSDQP